MSKKQKNVEWNREQALEIARTTHKKNYLEKLASHEWILVRLAVIKNEHTPLETLKKMQDDSEKLVASRASSTLFHRTHQHHFN